MSDFTYYLDRENNRFIRVSAQKEFDALIIGSDTWAPISPGEFTPISVRYLSEFVITDCQNGHPRTPENLCMANDGYLRCKRCREDKSEKNKSRRNFEGKTNDNKTAPVNPDAYIESLLEFNTNASVFRDKSKPGWGEISLRFNLSRKEAKILGEKLIEISQME